MRYSREKILWSRDSNPGKQDEKRDRNLGGIFSLCR